MYYTPNWFIPSIILFSTLVLFIWLFQKIWMFHIHICMENASAIFIFFTFFIYFPPLIDTLYIACLVLHSCPSLFRFLFIVQWDFCLGILPVHALCLSQYNSPPLYFLTIFPLSCVVQWFPVWFVVSCSYMDVIRFIIVHYLSSLLFFLP
jgi:hypothetical protein